MSNPPLAKDKSPARVDDASQRLFTRLEVIDDPQPHQAAFNMAMDESLLERLGDSPVLRIYRWSRPAISFGYFTDLAAVPVGEWELVRRWTGGGIVEHGNDFTYSLVVPRHALAAWGEPSRSYELIHGVLADALAASGFGQTAGHRAQAGPAAQAGDYCFEHPVAHDLMIAGRKASGAAQRRTRRGLLHQGSVQAPPTVAADWRNRLAIALPAAFSGEWETRSYTPAEEAGGTHLAATKYATPSWLQRF